MITFFACLVLLVVGFFTYGKLVEKVFRVDNRQTPAVAHPDGVDFVPMKTWRIYLIQLLNIAGLGPIYGALAGACWGPVVYLWIVFGTILGGGVHDFLSGMMSERHDGKSISELVGIYMGKVMTFIMACLFRGPAGDGGRQLLRGPRQADRYAHSACRRHIILAGSHPDLLSAGNVSPRRQDNRKDLPDFRHLPDHHGAGDRGGDPDQPRL